MPRMYRTARAAAQAYAGRAAWGRVKDKLAYEDRLVRRGVIVEAPAELQPPGRRWYGLWMLTEPPAWRRRRNRQATTAQTQRGTALPR